MESTLERLKNNDTVTRSDIASLLTAMPDASKEEKRAVVKELCEAVGMTHNPQGVAVWDQLDSFGELY